jgi:hypothetical protein
MSFDFEEEAPKEPAEEQKSDKTVPEARAKPASIEKNDECQYCGALYESRQTCQYCRSDPVKRAYLEGSGK